MILRCMHVRRRSAKQNAFARRLRLGTVWDRRSAKLLLAPVNMVLMGLSSFTYRSHLASHVGGHGRTLRGQSVKMDLWLHRLHRLHSHNLNGYTLPPVTLVVLFTVVPPFLLAAPFTAVTSATPFARVTQFARRTGRGTGS